MLRLPQVVIEGVVSVVVVSPPVHVLITGQVLVERRDIAPDALGAAALKAVELDIRMFDDSVSWAIGLGTREGVLLLTSTSLLGLPVLGHVLVVEDDLGIDLGQVLCAIVLKARNNTRGIDPVHDVVADAVSATRVATL